MVTQIRHSIGWMGSCPKCGKSSVVVKSYHDGDITEGDVAECGECGHDGKVITGNDGYGSIEWSLA